MNARRRPRRAAIAPPAHAVPPQRESSQPAGAGLPMIRARPLDHADVARPLLTAAQRQRLASVATRLELPPRTVVYREGARGDSVFINGGGVVISYSEMASGKRRVAGFRLYADVFGLAEHGKYVNTARAVTAVTLYRIPTETLARILREDAELEFHFLCKFVDELRRAQRKSIIVARPDATGRLAMFIEMLRNTPGIAVTGDSITVAMSRTDIADFLNLTLESVSRASRQLSDLGILAFRKHSVRVLDRTRFDQIVGSG